MAGRTFIPVSMLRTVRSGAGPMARSPLFRSTSRHAWCRNAMIQHVLISLYRYANLPLFPPCTPLTKISQASAVVIDLIPSSSIWHTITASRFPAVSVAGETIPIPLSVKDAVEADSIHSNGHQGMGERSQAIVAEARGGFDWEYRGLGNARVCGVVDDA